MRGRGLVASLVVVACLAGCGDGDVATSTSDPAPATEQEVQAVCDRFDEVRDREIGDMWSELLSVAPAEIRSELTRLTNGGPDDQYWEDREVVETFLDRCDDESD